MFLLFAIAAAIAAGLSDDFQARYNLALERVLHGGPPRYSVDFVAADAVPRHVRRFTEFSGDVSGRYLEALSVCARDRDDLRPRVNAVADQVIAHQRPDGHFGDPFADGPITPKHMAILWGNGRLLVGLVEAHRLTGRADLLESARRLGGFLVGAAARLNVDAVRQEYSGTQVAVGYICWTQTIEGLVALHEATRDARYLELARQVADRTGRHPSQHSHGYLTSLRGILRLHEATGDASLLARVEREWEELIASGNVFVHGAVPEAFKPIATRDEGCSEADWLRLNLALWKATGNVRYLDNAELTLFNEFAFNQFGSGDFGHRVLTPEGVSAANARAWWCCTFHGLRAYPDLFRAAFGSKDASLHYALPVSGEGRSGGLVMTASSSLARKGSVALRVTGAPATAPKSLSIRVPAWAHGIDVSLDGRRLQGQTSEGSWQTSRVWKPGEVLVVRYLFRTRTVADPGDESRVAVFHGPWMLGVDAHDSPAFFDEPFQENRIVLERGGDGTVRLNAAARGPVGSSRLTALVAHFSLPFLPGGYAVQRQSALLRPIADQTGLPDATAWVFWFKAAR